MSYKDLLEIIECRWDEMQTKENFIEFITEKGFDVIKNHIKGQKAEILCKNYTDDDYIIEFLVECCINSLDNRDFSKAHNYTEILYNLYERN